MSIRGLIMICFLAVSMSSLVCGAETDIEVHRTAILARFDGLQQFSAEIDRETIYTPPDNSPAGPATLPRGFSLSKPRTGIDTCHERLLFLHGQVLWDVTTSPETLARKAGDAAAPITRSVFALTTDRCEVLTAHGGKFKTVGLIDDPPNGEVPNEMTLDMALGLRLLGTSAALTRSQLEKADLNAAADGAVQLTVNDPRGNRHQWTYDPANACAITTYMVHFHDDSSYERVACSDFAKIGNEVLPRTVVREDVYVRSGKPEFVTRKITLKITQYLCPDDDLSSSKMLIVWPASSMIAEQRAGAVLRPDHNMPYDNPAIVAELAAAAQKRKNYEDEAQKRINANP